MLTHETTTTQQAIIGNICFEKPPVSLTLTPLQIESLDTLAAAAGQGNFISFMKARLDGKFSDIEGKFHDLNFVLLRFPELEPQLETIRNNILNAIYNDQIYICLTDILPGLPLSDIRDYSSIRTPASLVLKGLLYEIGYTVSLYHSDWYDIDDIQKIVLPLEKISAEELRLKDLLIHMQEVDRSVLFPEGTDHPLLKQMHETCYRHSAFIALLNHPFGQETLSSMIQPIANGNFVVRFLGHDSPIIVGPEHYLKNYDKGSNQFCAHVRGSLGTLVFGAAYSQLERKLEEYKNFGYGLSDGGEAALALHRITGWDTFWMQHDGVLLKLNPKSKFDYPANIDNLIEIPEPSIKASEALENDARLTPIRQTIDQIRQNFGDYILSAGSRSRMSLENPPYTIRGLHAFALTAISGDLESGLTFELVDPANSTTGKIVLSEREFFSYFRKLSGVVRPKSSTQSSTSID